jgi:acetyltransferase EpsM
MAQDRQRIVVVGAGGHGHVVVDALRSLTDAGRPIDVVAIVDDDESLRGTVIGGLTVSGGRALLTSIPHDAAIVAIGDNATRRRLQEEFTALGERLFAVCHVSAVVSREAVIEPGAMVAAGAVVGPRARVGAGAIVNTGARVDHHCDIGACAHVAPGATLAGAVAVGAETLVGLGAIVLPGVRIGSRSVLGAGTVVLTDVPDAVTVVGVPARVVERVRT